MTREQQFGDGVLTRLSMTVYTLLVVELLLLGATLPGLVVLTLLDRDASNVPLAAVAALPVGPALSAALVTLHGPRDVADLRPATVFVRAYRRNALAVLRVWVPFLVALTVIGVDLAHREAVGVPGAWAALLLLIALGALLWGVNALLISSFFTFRTRDVARLAWDLLPRSRSAAAGTASILVLAAAVVVLGSEAVLALSGSVAAMLLLAVNRPTIDLVAREFTV